MFEKLVKRSCHRHSGLDPESIQRQSTLVSSTWSPCAAWGLYLTAPQSGNAVAVGVETERDAAHLNRIPMRRIGTSQMFRIKIESLEWK